ncbi:MAG: CDP-glucose 4,6-dehydratase [Planctomycetes bacterium]|nr:CDP-glucose 4,6-dehydratase [Planctomycetota bacterium]
MTDAPRPQPDPEGAAGREAPGRQVPVRVADVAAGYAGRRVLVTGHTGFKGAWLACWLHTMGARVTGLALDPPTTPSLFEDAGLATLLEDHRADIRDAAAVRSVVTGCQPEIIFHLAAQPLVRPSYDQPLETLATNVMGTANLLDACRGTSAPRAVVVVTSDKCYRNNEWVWGYRENDPMGGDDPYSASKGCAELVTAAFVASYFGEAGPAVATARAGNVVGGGDWAKDRLVPDCIRAFQAGRPVRIRCPHALRPWQHVLDALWGYLTLGGRLMTGGRVYTGGWNFAPLDSGDVWPVGQVVERLCRLWGDGAGAATTDTTIPEANRLWLDASQARVRLGWQPVWKTENALAATVAWYRGWHRDRTAARRLMIGQLEEYLAAVARREAPVPAGNPDGQGAAATKKETKA